MRLGGPVYRDPGDPERFALAHKEKGYGAAYCPDGLKAGDTQRIRAYADAFAKHGVVVAEVGAWCNPMDPDESASRRNIGYVAERLTLADELGAVTCVNIVGSQNPKHWFGPCAKNFGSGFFDYAVEVSRKIIDIVKPARAKMSFEMLPYGFPDTAAEYLRFLAALDRKEAGIHFDPVNCINSPRAYYGNAAYLAETIKLLGNGILSVHLKDLAMRDDTLSVMFDEVQIGAGGVDYVSLLKELNALPADTPCMLEHLPDESAYDAAASAARHFAEKAGVKFAPVA